MAVTLGVSVMMNLNGFQSQTAQFNPNIQIIEPKIITTERGNEAYTGLEITTGAYPLQYQTTLKIDGNAISSASDTITPNTKISRGISSTLDSGKYLVALEYVADGTDNLGNPIHLVDTKYYNIVVP